MSSYQYEVHKVKSIWSKMFLTTLVSQFLAFIFFTIVGKFDGSSDTIVSFQGIIALSNTVSMCGVSIYGAVLLRENLVRFYIGNQRNRTFLFPVARRELLVKRTTAFFTVSLTSFGSALVLLVLIEMVLGILLKLESENVVLSIYLGCTAIVTSCLLLFVILMVSEMVSLWQQSEVASIITAGIGMLIVSNFSAMGLMNFPTLTCVISLLLGAIIVVIFLKFSKGLDEMEVY